MTFEQFVGTKKPVSRDEHYALTGADMSEQALQALTYATYYWIEDLGKDKGYLLELSTGEVASFDLPKLELILYRYACEVNEWLTGY